MLSITFPIGDTEFDCYGRKEYEKTILKEVTVMKAIRKAHEVDFWVWKKEWSKRQAAVELDKFFHQLPYTFKCVT